MRSSSVVQGRLAKSVGDNFESWIDAQHDAAMRLGLLAHIEHTQARARVLHGRLQYVGKGVADYVGVLCAHAKALAAEAKSTSALRLLRKAVKKKQALHLEAVSRAGGLALLLVEFRSEGRARQYAVPWIDVPWVTLRSAESVCEADLVKWRIQPGECYLSKFCPPGKPQSSPIRGRVYPRE